VSKSADFIIVKAGGTYTYRSVLKDKPFVWFAGRPPDFLAFVITILMTLLMAAGVKKSLVFNNVLNALNLSVWVFVMTAGLFYVDTSNWSDHKGFLPYGWPGVSVLMVRSKQFR
jgi:cationic amino acid transporter 14